MARCDPTSPGRSCPARAGKTWPGPVANLVVEAMSETLKDRAALVTGGGRGIGQAICFGLAGQGARVAVLARSADQVRETARHITGRGGQALALTARTPTRSVRPCTSGSCTATSKARS